MKVRLHSAGAASRLAALRLAQILPVFSLVAPCHPGASPASVRRRTFTTGCHRRPWLLVAVAAAFALRLSAASAPGLRLPDLDNRLVDPFQTAADTRAIVFLFISVDCPISNRYAPE